MTTHEAFLDLAAAAIDFPLSKADRARLESHLQDCPACARSAAGMRAYALALADLPRRPLPERRGAEILAVSLRPRTTLHPLRLVEVAAVLALLALGALAVGSELARRADVEWPAVLPAPSATAPLEVTPPPASSAMPSQGPALPGGALIAYSSRENGRPVVRTVYPGGSGMRTVADGAAPAWSPDGTLLAFECPPGNAYGAPPESDVCVAAADGSGRRVVARQAAAPAWSPDGSRLLFSRSVIDAGDTWVVGADGSGERSLGGGTGSWSPDGQWVLLLGASGAEPDATLVRPDGSGARSLGTCAGAAWSPDATRLACTVQRGREGELHTVAVDGGSGPYFQMTAQAVIASPTWLTNQRLVVGMRGDGSGDVPEGDHLYLVDMRLGDQMSLADGSLAVTSVAPGGEWVAATGGDGDASDVHLVSVAGEARALTRDGVSGGARWQPRPASAAPEPRPTPEPLAKLSAVGGILPASGTAAWASTAAGLYRTTDGGATWARVAAPTPHYLEAAVAPDADALLLPGPGQPVSVTRDGGATWTAVDFPSEAPGSEPMLSFATADHGFATFTAGGNGVRVYETLDAGRTWRGPTAGAMPLGPLDGLQGPENGVLWLSSGKADDKPFDNRLAYSLDGGVAWHEAQFPTGRQAPRADLKGVETIRADASGRVVLAMTMGSGPQLYTSEDGGRTWAFVRSWPPFRSGTTTVGWKVALLSADEWAVYAGDGSGSWSTSDAGATWRHVTGTAVAVLDEVVPASADRAWAVHRCDDRRSLTTAPEPICSDPAVDTVLFTTTDAGATWTQVRARD